MSAALKDALVSFVRVWIVGTVTIFLPGLFGWINDVTSWAKHEGTTPFPDAHGLVFLFVAAITSAFVAAGMALLRYVENVSGKHLLPRPAGPELRPRGGVTPPGDRGAVSLRVVVLVVVVVVVLLILLR